MTFSPISSIRRDWSEVETGDSVLQDLYGGFHRSRVGIVDLDPKPISAIIKHHLREAEMIKAYNNSSLE
ncbi:unnamed protein product [Allacma fusca]|uniref:Uncharacterized protein n=1 Tax=Allacma fusca TaxID=39272 RepID=A0A8J2K5I0_9HEXA|nr:unnamed protein product [Allacma fusca]